MAIRKKKDLTTTPKEQKSLDPINHYEDHPDQDLLQKGYKSRNENNTNVHNSLDRLSIGN